MSLPTTEFDDMLDMLDQEDLTELAGEMNSHFDAHVVNIYIYIHVHVFALSFASVRVYMLSLETGALVVWLPWPFPSC